MNNTQKSPEALRILMELRRSNAATPIPNKKLYKRKSKYPKMSVPSDTIK